VNFFQKMRREKLYESCMIESLLAVLIIFLILKMNNLWVAVLLPII
jgi:hypothetical protein